MKQKIWSFLCWFIIIELSLIETAIMSAESKRDAYPVDTTPIIHVVKFRSGIASWYDYSLKGIVWSKNHRTAASRHFKRYSTVRVTNVENGKSVEVYINDYGPESWTGREIDLSSYAFSQIADLKLGLIKVRID